MMREELIDYYYEQRRKGMDFSQIRKELFDGGLTSDEVKRIIRAIDNHLVDDVRADDIESSSEGIERLVIGALLLIGGVGLTLGTFYFPVRGYSILAFGPIMAGLALIGRRRRRSRLSSSNARRFKR